MSTILFCGEDRLFRWFVGEALRDSGYEVLEAQAGEDLLRLSRLKPHLLLLDLELMDQDGMDLLGRLRDSAPDVPVIVLVPFTNEGERRAAERAAPRRISS